MPCHAVPAGTAIPAPCGFGAQQRGRGSLPSSPPSVGFAQGTGSRWNVSPAPSLDKELDG